MTCYVQWFEKRCAITPERTAVIDGETGERWNYEQMDQRSARLAQFLQDSGIVKGDRVALLSPNHICYFDFLFACYKLGAIFVPLNWRLSTSELGFILRDCTPKLIAHHSVLLALAEALFSSCERMTVDSAEYDEIIMSEEYETKVNYLSAEEVLPSNPIAIIYTGGTTGRPKGVVLSYQSIFWNSINTIISWSLTANDITPTYLPMFHTGGLNALSLPILHIGGTVVLARQFEAEQVVELLNRERCTIALLVPTMYHLLIQSDAFAASCFSTMHTFMSGGAPCSRLIYRVFEAKGLAFKEGYGLTEAGPNNFYIHPKDALQKLGSVGKPMLYNEIKLVDEHGEEITTEEVGEIFLRGDHLFESYWNLPLATAEVFVHGWLSTGDLGKRDAEGFYYIVGRKKDMIISGGENVYPLEVEQLIQQHPAVEDAAVVGYPDKKWGEIVAAMVVLRPDSNLTEDELKVYCSTRIGKYKVPKKIVIVHELPKTPVGKIDKNQIIDNLC